MEKDTIWELFSSAMRAKFFNMREFFKTLFHYYRNPLFWHIDLHILWEYVWKSPYKICRELTLQSYGETPFSVWSELVKLASITKGDRVLDLGAGRGRGCFWLNTFIGCHVHGIEIIPYFVKVANHVKETWHVEGVQFTCEDLFAANFEGYSVIYLYALDMSDEDLGLLNAKFEALPTGTRIITVGYSIPEMVPTTKLRVIDECEVRFPWGKTKASCHV